MKPQFPSPFSPQRLSVAKPTASSFNKTPLKPGHSLMDWIRLTKSGADLRGVGPGLKQISEKELANHNKVDDAWMAIRGFVYNVSKYMNYHPGGPDELMRGAGKDATMLFNEIHRWVNFESMLQACLIGKLVSENTSKSSGSSLNFLVPPPVAPTKLKPSTSGKSSSINIEKVSTEWSQTDDSVIIVTKTLCKLDADDVICDVNDNSLFATIFVNKENVAIVNAKFPIQVSLKSVEINNSGRNVNIVLSKKVVGVECKSVEYLKDHCKVMKRKSLDLHYRPCALVKKTTVTHNTALYQLQLPSSCHMRVPVGSHVYLQGDNDGITISRPYTVIIPDLITQISESDQALQDIHLMIKVYENGALTPLINEMKIGDQILLSTYEGSFKLSSLKDFNCLVLFCAGTGFTPMVRLIYHCLFESKKKVVLFFFNKKPVDILWKSQLDFLLNKFESTQFNVRYVLSEPDDNWTGSIGRISPELINDAFHLASENYFTCVCGPPQFTRLTEKFLAQIDKTTNLHVFTS